MGINKERAEKGFVCGGVASIVSTAGAIGLTYLGNPDKISSEIVQHPEIITITSELTIMYVLGCSVGGAILNGYIFPAIDRAFNNIHHKLDNFEEKINLK